MARGERFRALRVLSLSAVILAAAGGAWLWSRRNDMPAAARAALEQADTFELLSLNPRLAEDEFHNRRVLGRTAVTNPSTRARLAEALRNGARESDGSVMACFNPRHGIRATRAGRVTDLVICFECRQVHVYRDGKRAGSFLTTASPQAAFDRVLRDAGVPLAREEE
jgi:hypothetical protein